MNRSLMRGFLSVFSAKLTTVLVTILITPVLVRLLGSDGYGEYAFVISTVGVLMILVNAGIYDGVRKFIAEQRDDPHWEAHVFGFYLRLAVLLAVVAAAIVAVVAWSGLVGRQLGRQFERYFFLVAILIGARQLFQTARGALMGIGLEEYSESFLVGRKVTFAVVGLSLAAVGWSVTGVLVGHAVANVALSLPAMYVLSAHVDLRAAVGRLPPAFPRRLLAVFNLESVVLILLTASLYHVDILLLQPISGSQETGHYRAALLVVEFLWFVPFVFQTVLLHSSSELWSKGETERISALASRVTRYTLSLTILLGLGIAALAEPFMRLYFGPEFTVAASTVLLLLPGTLGFAVARPIFAIGQGKGQLRVLIAATGTASAVNFGLNLLLIPQYGMMGAAIATSVGYGSMLVLHVLAARRIGFRPLGAVRPVRLAAVVAGAGPVIFGLAWLVPTPVSLVVVPPIGGLVYVSLALWFGLVSVDELEDALDWVPPGLAATLRRLVRWVR